MFISSFLYFCWRSLASKQALDLVKALVSLVGVILGGYFVQEGAAMYFYRSQGVNAAQSQYTTQVLPTYDSTAATIETAPEVMVQEGGS